MSKKVLYLLEDGIGRVILNRPEKYNAINKELLEDFIAALEEANADKDCSVILLSAEGPSFGVGDDITDANTFPKSRDEAIEFFNPLQQVSRLLMFNKKPVVGAIQGWCVGGAFSWALNCDFPLWACSAKGYLPEAKYGVFLTGAASFLIPERAGYSQGLELVLGVDKLSSDTLEQHRIAWRVVPDEALQEEAFRFASHLARLPASFLENIKQSAIEPLRDNIEKALIDETAKCIEALFTSDAAEKMKSAVSKSTAVSGA